ncbi:hypothetical protein D3C85_1931770 [compost metagenome]
MIGKVRTAVFEEISMQVNDLLSKAMRNDNEAVVTKMKTIVPEFKSQNSIYEALDVIPDSV